MVCPMPMHKKIEEESELSSSIYQQTFPDTILAHKYASSITAISTQDAVPTSDWYQFHFAE